MMNIFNDYKRMKNAELRDYHKRVQSRRNFWIACPIIVGTAGFLLCCLSGWGTYAEVMMNASGGYHASTNVFGMFTWILFAVLTGFLPLESDERKFAPAILMGAYFVLLLLFGRLSVAALLMVCYYVGAAIALKPIRSELEFLRSLPNYPFLDRTEMDEEVELKVQKYYENSPTMQREMKKSKAKAPRVYDSSMTEEALSTLPKKHIEEIHINRGYFDEPEQTYTDKLANDPGYIDRLSRKENFEEPEQGFNDKVINAPPRANTDPE